LAFVVCPKSKNEICHGNPSELILFFTGWGFDARGEPDQAKVANRSTDFNPDWIRRIVLFVSELVKLEFIVFIVE